jgi:phosphoglycolate phosphatase
MYQCCIFDLDGTLVDSIKAIAYTANLTLKKYKLGPVDEEHYKIFVGDGYKKLLERVLIHCGDNELIHYEDAIITYMKYFKVHCMHEVKAYDGIKDMLDYLKNNKLKIAVLSNKPHERTIENVEGIFGEGYFDVIAGEKEEVRRKPDPEGAIIIAKELRILPDHCLYIGDTNTDMETGIGAGMDTVGVTWGFRTRKELESYKPKYIINSPSEIIDIVKSNTLGC